MLIQKIADLQSDGDGFYEKGLFPSQRIHTVIDYVKEDNTIFYSALISLTLQEIRPYLDVKDPAVIDTIINNIKLNYSKYKNKDKGPTYNFWQTSPSRHFPNDRYLSALRKFILPDDFDDTSILYMTDDSHKEFITELKSLMIRHTNLYNQQVNNVYEKYKNTKAYSSWFGKDMPIDFDICVLANTMGMVYSYDLPLNEYDSASLFLINQMISDNDHIRSPSYISPHYKKTSTILYHLSRLISNHDPQILRPIKDKVIRDINSELNETDSFMEYIILSTSLMRMGYCPDINKRKLKNDIGTHNYFVANMVSTLKNPWKRILGSGNLFAFPYCCEAYDYVLILENLSYRKHLACDKNEGI